MKRIILVFITALLAAMPLTGCAHAGPPEARTQGGKLRVVATSFAPYDLAREVASGLADITMLLPPGAEAHSFEPTPQDMIRIQNCDVFIYVGGESDAWVDRVLNSLDTSSLRTVTLMDCVEAVEEELTEGMQAEEEEHDAQEAVYDEHIWTSPRNAKLIAARICAALKQADPINADAYARNADAFSQELDALDAAFADIVKNAKRTTLVFGDRFPFRYFADAYGLTYFAAFPGCASETEPSAATVKFLIDKVSLEQIPAVFHIELSSKKMADTIAEATGAQVLLLHSCHNVTPEDFTSGESYLSLMAQNAQALKVALR